MCHGNRAKSIFNGGANKKKKQRFAVYFFSIAVIYPCAKWQSLQLQCPLFSRKWLSAMNGRFGP